MLSIGEGIALAAVALAVVLAVRSIRKSHKKGGCH